MIDFVSLHNQTSYSLLDSLIDPKELLLKAKELNQKAVAITDHASLAAAWEAWKASKEVGIKLIIGCECYFVDDASSSFDKLRHIILLAKNAVGYRNLLILNKKGFDNNIFIGKKLFSVIDWNLLKQYAEGLICLTACGNGIISQLLMLQKKDEAENSLLQLKEIFGDNLGLEIQPNNMKRGRNVYNEEIDQNYLNRQLIKLGQKYNIRIVAACNTHYLNKDEYETHDALLSIGSHQPILSNFRLKYTVNDFYLKLGDEVKEFFSRNFGDELAQSFCDNSIYFADLCEIPEWIDPKFSNPSGKELPLFPIKDESDYQEFLIWKEKQSEVICQLDEDKQFLRYRCDKLFDNRCLNLTEEQREQYKKRVEEELDVLEFHGISSYMLLVADYIDWARKNNIAVGEGRGCNFFDTLVLTTKGYKKLGEIKIGDYIYSHTGRVCRVSNTYEFDLKNDEKLLSIRSEHAFSNLIMTNDHKILSSKLELTEKYLRSTCKSKNKYKKIKKPINSSWIEAKDLNKNDYIYTKFPIRKSNIIPAKVDLAKFIDYKYNKVSVLKNKISYIGTKINRYISYNKNFVYFLGRFVGNGWFNCANAKSNQHVLGVTFNTDDKVGIKKMFEFFKSFGLSPKLYFQKQKKVVQIIIYNKIFVSYMRHIFPNYKQKAETKSFPNICRYMSTTLLRSFLLGLFYSYGSVEGNREYIDTISLKMALEIKEALLFLRIPSTINIRQPYVRNINGKQYNCKLSYKVRFNGLKTPINNKYFIYKKGNPIGYFSRILNIKENNQYNKVYDITVENDNSYLTTNGVVHNSVGGCLIAYILGIHQADPIKYNLIFERFHNKDRFALADIDVDISTTCRQKVIQYLKNKYGSNNVCSISNYNTITPKVYVRDIARASEFGGSKEEAVRIGNDLAGAISDSGSQSNNINSLLKESPLLSEYCKTYNNIIKFASILGKPRAASQHAAGLIIGQRSLVGLAPLRVDNEQNLIIEYDKDYSEENGFVKMDVLGVSNLDTIKEILDLIKERRGIVPQDYNNYDLNDAKTYELISAGDTFGVFQFGTSAGTIDLCKKVKPKNMEDLAIITTLARPAAANIRNDFILAKEGKNQVVLLHPSLEGAFKKTYGYGLYDESILQLGRDVAGWDLNSADRIRKMIKDKGKNPEKDRKLRQEFIDGAIKNGIEPILATRIFEEEVKKFGSYTFNKSHALMYSMLSYQTAYLKAHFPIEFLLVNLMAEVKSNAPTAAENILKIKKELRQHRVKIVPPDLNKSQLTYTIEDENKLITGLDAIKFVGDEAILDIIAKRPFKNFTDFMVRVSSKTVRANSIQALAATGALDCFKLSRKLIFLYCSDFRKKLQIWLKKHDPNKEEFIYPWPTEPDWSISELYALEQYYLGEAFICKPPLAYGNFFKDNHSIAYDIRKSDNKTPFHSVKGIVRDFFEFSVKKENSKYYGKKMVKANIEDRNGEFFPLTIFPDRWEMMKKRLLELNKKTVFESGLALHFSGISNSYENNMGIILNDLFGISLPPAVPNDLKAKKLNLKLAKNTISIEKPKNPQELGEQIEEALYNEGLVDLDD